MDQATIEQLARKLAKANREAEPEIEQVYWFPSESEVRLVEVQRTLPKVKEKRLQPFYFRPAPDQGLPAWMAIALIHPDEYRDLELPNGWGSWDDAKLLEGDA